VAGPGKLKAEALWYSGPGHAEIRPQSLAEVAADEVRVRAMFSAISRGTERLVFTGRVPKTEFERMRAPFMEGAFPFPVKYGYASVGRVEAGPTHLCGQPVFVLHPHQSLFNVPVEAVVPIPSHVPPQRAVLAANMETALNALWDAAPGPCDRITVVGAGVVGSLVAWLAGRLPGAQVTIVDVLPARAELAHRLGVDFAPAETAPSDCDLVVHASGSSQGLAIALQLAGEEASILELSWYGSGEVVTPLGGPFHSRRLRLISSQVGRVAPSHRPRWTTRRRLAAALDLLADEALDVLLTPSVALADAPQRLPEILAPNSPVLCQVIHYPATEAVA
jgi:2-desacetyl-2-hydroxyethyl bacteriochlorophyllide A dehydrogenase